MPRSRVISSVVIVVGCLAGLRAVAADPLLAKHLKVYHEPGRFGGWPANHGIWSWGNEILVGFGRGYDKDQGDSHHIDRDQPEEHLLARTLDGGETWSIEDPSRGGLIPGGASMFGKVRPDLKVPTAVECSGGIDFTHPDFCLTLRMFSSQVGQSQFFYSYDRGKTWKGPFHLSVDGVPSIQARTNYLVNGQHDCFAFLSTSTMDLPTGPGQRSFCARTTDGGKTWKFVGWIGPPVKGNAIMPSVARTADDGLLAVLRRRASPKAWLSAFRSGDEGQTWEPLVDPADDLGRGNPPSLIQLKDGRMCLTYGVRLAPHRICARLSNDDGRTWSEEFVLRDDGASHDIGYPRSAQRPDGNVVTIYYFTDKATGPERYIGATIWEPPAKRQAAAASPSEKSATSTE